MTSHPDGTSFRKEWHIRGFSEKEKLGEFAPRGFALGEKLQSSGMRETEEERVWGGKKAARPRLIKTGFPLMLQFLNYM